MNPNDAIQTLLNEGLTFARTMLQEHGEFFPFAMTLDRSGQIRPAEPHRGSATPSPAELIRELEQQLRERVSLGSVAAAGVFVKVRVGQGAGAMDAIQASLEAPSGFCTNVIVPFSTARGQITLGEPFATDRQPTVFVGR